VVPAPAVSSHRYEWRWRRSGVWDYVVTGVALTGFAIEEFAVHPAKTPNWTGPILFDSGVRDALVARTPAGRNRAAQISDFFQFGVPGFAVAESVILPLALDNWNIDVAWELTAIDLQTLSITGLFARMGHRFVRRERPDVEPCQQDRGYDNRCSRGKEASFPAGHPAGTIAGAGLICSHHLNLGLYGNEAADIAVCAVATTGGVFTGVLRIMADRHYASDVLVGSALGAATGYGLPLLFHYRRPRSEKTASALRWTLAPAPDAALGMSVYGWF
jgi:hypothetical protein